MEKKAQAADRTHKQIEDLMNSLQERFNHLRGHALQTNAPALEHLDHYFDELVKLNTQFDKQATKVFKTAMNYGIPKEKVAEGYKDTLEEYTKQNKVFNECYKISGYLTKKATKCQKHLNKIMEKYMNEMSKLVLDMH